MAVICIKICADAERVVKRHDLVLNGAKLCAKALKVGRPPTFVTADDTTYLSDTFLFIDLPRRLDANKLQQYAEKATGTCVDKMIFSCTNPSVALIKYTAAPGIDTVFLLALFFVTCVC